jgi:hypothetical protein
MSFAQKKSKSRHDKACSKQFFAKSREPLNIKVTAINLLFLAAFFIQMQYSTAQTKQPILINSEFTQPQKLQLCFCPMGKYVASMFTSHIRIPFNYSSLINLQQKMNDRLDNFFDVLHHWNFSLEVFDEAMMKSTFKLYKDNTNEIFKLFHDKANCKFQISDTREKIFSLGNNTWLVYSVGTIATNHVCPKARSSSPLTISSGQAVMVQSGCHIPTMDHLIMADESEEMEVHSTWLDWTMSLLQLFDHNDAEQITSTVHKIRDTMTGSFDASELLQQLDQLDKPFQSTHWTFLSPAAMIGIFLLIALLSFTTWKKCCTKPMIQPALPAPTTLPPVNPNVPLQPANPALQPKFNFQKSAAPKSITIINF